MSPVQSIGPLFYVNGPLPRPPGRSLTKCATIRELGDEHWMNGIAVHGYIPDTGVVWGSCPPGEPVAKQEQQTANPTPEFGPMTAYLAETCSTKSIMVGSQAESEKAFKERAAVTFAAVESAAIARELWTGAELPDNPHLADANADVLNSGAATGLVNGLALLEEAIADTGRAGVIHLSVGTALAASALGGGLLVADRGGCLFTVNGTLVIVDAGYDGSAPEGETPSAGTVRWAYATGPVEVLRSEPFLVPNTLREAIDREQNSVTYRAERYYIPFWDTALQAAVAIDRCFTSCDS
jgi:hypothetical protein